MTGKAAQETVWWPREGPAQPPPPDKPGPRGEPEAEVQGQDPCWESRPPSKSPRGPRSRLGPQGNASQPGCGRVSGSSGGARPPRVRWALLLPGQAGLALRIKWTWREYLCPRAMSPPGCPPEGGLLGLPSQPCPHRPRPAHPEAWGCLHPGQACTRGHGAQSSECREQRPLCQSRAAAGEGGAEARAGLAALQRGGNGGPCAGRPPLPGAARGPQQVTVPTQGALGGWWSPGLPMG